MTKITHYLCGVALLLSPFQIYAYETETDLVEAKLEATKKLPSLEAGRNEYGSFNNPEVRQPNLRDSGRDGTLLFVNNTNFRFVEDIGFYVPKLAVKLEPNDPAAPVVFDDPTSFSITPLQGEVVLSGAALEALLNKHVFSFRGAPLRAIKVATRENLLILSGEMNRRGQWVPFKMKGNLSLSKGHILKYKPWSVVVDGEDATKVLKVANVKLDELLTVRAKGANLIGSTVVLDALLLFPPPVLNLNIASSRLEERGLVLGFNETSSPSFPESLTGTQSSLIVKGGDVKFLRAMPINALVEIQSTDSGKEFDFNLYRFRDQLTAGHIRLREDGAILAYLKNFNEL